MAGYFDSEPLGIASYVVSTVVLAFFGAMALVVTRRFLAKKKDGDSLDFFFTARNSIGTMRIAYSFFSGALGSWVIFGPPSYAPVAGILGTIMYAVSCGLPIIIIALFGSEIKTSSPRILSLTDWVNSRFGRIAQVYVFIIMAFNMAIAMTAEYTAIGDLFEIVLGQNRYAIVIIMGVITTIYTAFGGLYVSIITDAWQSILAILLFIISFITVCVTFKQPLNELPASIGWDNPAGLASIFVMPVSLLTSTVYSEAMWQRCWAAENHKALQNGAIIGGVLTIIIVFLSGMGGVIAVWSQLWNPATDAYNTILFTLLKNLDGGNIWVVGFIAVLAATMSESAVDSLQNALTDLFGSVLLAKYNINWSRAVVVLINAPILIVSLQGFNVLQLFLMANLITSTCSFPVFLGVSNRRWIKPYLTQGAFVFSAAVSLISLFLYAGLNYDLVDVSGVYQAEDYPLNVSSRFNTVFFYSYDWPPFLIAVCTSVAGTGLWMLALFLLNKISPSTFPVEFVEPTSTLESDSSSSSAETKPVDEVVQSSKETDPAREPSTAELITPDETGKSQSQSILTDKKADDVDLIQIKMEEKPEKIEEKTEKREEIEMMSKFTTEDAAVVA